jgi:hypothetical protein
MRIRIIIIIASVILIFSSFIKAEGQVIFPSSESQIICYAGNKITRIYIPPPPKHLRAKGSKGATIKVTYIGFTTAAKTAMEHAVSILSEQLPAGVLINVTATWMQMTEPGVLGSTGVTAYFRGSVFDAINPYVYYPVTLAEKISGKDLNATSEPDIQISFNSKMPWYTGIDGNTPVTKYDLVTVVLHEMCHGLGFNDSMDSNDTIGWYGFNSIPVIYDSFIENSAGRQLIDPNYFTNYSTGLNSQLTGGSLFFNGPLLINYTSGIRAKLYAPKPWAPGSSISHLNETGILQVNAMMTPFIDLGEAIHDPGKLTMSILGDIGWISTRLFHTPFKDTEQNPGNLDFKVKIKSDTLFNKNMVGLVYSTDNFISDDTLLLAYNPLNDTFSVAIASPAYNTRISYYFFTGDCFNRIYKLPSGSPQKPYVFFVGTDTVKPVLIHAPLDYFFERIDTIRFSSDASDNIGIDSVYIEYKINTGQTKYLKLNNDSLTHFSNFIRFAKGSLKGSDSISYKVIAVDKANLGNKKYLPAAGYYIIHIEAISSVYDSYVTDFSSGSGDFVNRGFSVIQPSNFTSPALHTTHPYESPEKDSKTIEYTSVINHPVTVDATGMMITYKEVVLVEPGASGSVFGSPDFYDYVIVEASKNFGKTWFALASGYDSRISAFFESTYNRAFIGMNSKAIGKEDMYANHTIDLRSSSMISTGDTIMFRFRLFSDAYAHGWGWAIDNYSIRSIASDIEKISMGSIGLYPNPGTGKFTLDTRKLLSGKKMELSVINSSGVRIIQKEILSGEESLFDISGFPSGIYILLIGDGRKLYSIKYCLTGY